MDDFVAALRRCAPFNRMEPAHLAWLGERLRLQGFAPGEVLLAPGQSPDRLYFIAAGALRLEAMGEGLDEPERVLAELVAGECFPLEALHEKRPVFSTFRARDELLCYTLGAEHFAELVASSPLFGEFCRQRSQAFLDSSRRIFQAHFAQRSEEASSLASPLRALLRPAAAVCAQQESVRTALERIEASGESAAVIVDAAGAPCGSFSLRDLAARVLLVGGSLEQPVEQVMAPGPVMLPPEADGYEAAYAMAHRGALQVLVVEQGRLIGVVRERDLFSAQRIALSQLPADIRRARDVATLSRHAQDIRQLARNLMAQGLAAEPLTRIISSLNDRLSCRVIELIEAQQPAPLPPYCWLAIGSEGRHEQTLCTDQDNGIVFEAADAAAARAALLPFALRVNEALAACGFPLCKGQVMASNPLWCLSLAEWKSHFAGWLRRPDPEALLNASIFFDFRALHGEARLAAALSDWLVAEVPRRGRFFHNLVAQALARTPPIGFFRDFVVEDHAEHPDTLDLKLAGAALFVDAARILGLRHGVAASNTVKRLREAARALRVGAAEAEAWVEAFHFIQLLRLRNQYQALERGGEPHNRIDPYALNDLDRKVFLEALRQARKLQKRLELDLGATAGR